MMDILIRIWTPSKNYLGERLIHSVYHFQSKIVLFSNIKYFAGTLIWICTADMIASFLVLEKLPLVLGEGETLKRS